MLNTAVKNDLKHDLDIMSANDTNPTPKTFRDPVLSGGPSCPLNDALYSMSPNIATEMMNYAQQNAANLVNLSQGESCTPTPSFITDSASKALQNGETFYNRALGLPELRQEISDYYKRIYNQNISPDRVAITASGSNAMNVALRALLNVGDEVLAVTPIWKNLLGAAELSGAKIIQSPLEEDENGWNLNLEKLFESCTPQTKAILLVSPSNPTGWCINADEIKAILEFARKRGIWIIADEVYNRLVYDGQYGETFLDYADPEDLLVVINSFSKSWAMTGWRLGWVTAPAFMTDRIRLVSVYNNMCVATFVQHAGITALRDGEDFIQSQIQNWKINRDLVFDTLKNYDSVQFSKPEASFYAFFKVKNEPDCIKYGYKMLDETGLLLAPGITFGDSSKGYMRMSFACSHEKIQTALDRLTQIL